AAFYHRIPIGHIEAGLRTGDMAQPFPEEMNRVVTTRLADLHFAPTLGAAANLATEGIPAARIHVTGNTGIDSVLYVRELLESGELPLNDGRDGGDGKRLILVTSHRRETFGTGFARVMKTLLRIAQIPGVGIVYPVHRNPHVLGPAHELLAGQKNIRLIEPSVMCRSWISCAVATS